MTEFIVPSALGVAATIGIVGFLMWRRPFASRVAAGFVRWLPLLAYPERVGMHSNTAWALTRSLPYARQRAATGDTALLDAIDTAAHRLYASDRDYPFCYEPSGADFLSGGLAEAGLMREVLGARFAQWWAGFGGAVDASQRG